MKKLYFSLFFIFILFSGMFATPLRIIGMGSLDLIVEDESNRINLFDYGGNIAGLYEDEMGSSIETYVTYGTIRNSDLNGPRDPQITYWGDNIPTDIMFLGFNTASLEGIPVGAVCTYRMSEGYAFSGAGAYSCRKSKFEISEFNESMPMGVVIVSRDFGKYAAGLSGGYSKLTLTWSPYDTKYYETLVDIKGGLATRLSPMLNIGISGGITIPEVRARGSNYESSGNGNAFSGGFQSIVRVSGLLKSGTRINYLNGKLDWDMDKMRVTDLDFDTRLLFSSILFPLKVGASFNYKRTHRVYNSISILEYDVSFSVTNFGIGVSYATPFLTPGIQYNLYNKTSTDNLDNGESTNSSKWDVRFGGEVPLTIITLRAGYIIAKEDPDTDRENDESKSRSITLGAGIQFPLQPFKIEVAYVNKETQPVDNPDDSKETENSIYAALKLRF